VVEKRKIVVIGMIFILTMPAIATNDAIDHVDFISNNNDEKTLYVGGSGPNNYTKIQDAINDSNDGDTVFVYSGIYNESIMLYKRINLIGEHREKTIISARGGDGINITAEGVSVNNFTITDAVPPYSGVQLYKTANNIISHCDIYGCKDGIVLFFSHNNGIQECNISTDGGGIMLWQSSLNKIKLCNIVGTTNSMSLFGYLTFGNLITNNNFIDNRWDPVFINSIHNLWFHNYWDDWHKIVPKPIFGINLIFLTIQIPWIQFDWHPAREPYEWWR